MDAAFFTIEKDDAVVDCGDRDAVIFRGECAQARGEPGHDVEADFLIATGARNRRGGGRCLPYEQARVSLGDRDVGERLRRN
ncbi:hypothetical protein GCM10011372_32620 [Agromyces bauzanensis]|uniref:Uncharacterized protein n=1 Tax=Agromyces bauzanensis TaxID=1308924 RepID=A0A917PTU9_9MICO|nr:hypothetical protein GCM10011372_32620 [Agromyces bauzanensis]